jgi:hypothetical protein
LKFVTAAERWPITGVGSLTFRIEEMAANSGRAGVGEEYVVFAYELDVFRYALFAQVQGRGDAGAEVGDCVGVWRGRVWDCLILLFILVERRDLVPVDLERIFEETAQAVVKCLF